MPNNKISPDLFSTTNQGLWRTSAPRPSLVARVTARLRAFQFDRQLAVGVPAQAGTALAVHEARLTSVPEREAIAHALLRAVHEARTGRELVSARIPVHRNNILSAEDLIDTITLRLHSPRPVSGRGIARLRLVMSDGCGPMYEDGRGDLSGRLGAALAAL